VDDTILDGGLNSSFLLLDEPEAYNLPRNPPRPMKNVAPASLWAVLAATILSILGMLFFREKTVE
jgi:formate dehydrogenase iron-sulfur subunit